MKLAYTVNHIPFRFSAKVFFFALVLKGHERPLKFIHSHTFIREGLVKARPLQWQGLPANAGGLATVMVKFYKKTRRALIHGIVFTYPLDSRNPFLKIMEGHMARHRMILSLPEDLHASLMRLSSLTGSPASNFVVELLTGSKDRIDEISNTIESAKEGHFDSAASTLDSMASKALDDINNAKDDLKQALTRQKIEK